MTGREKFLLGLLGWLLAGALGLAGATVYLDGLNQLDNRFASWQKQAVQIQRRLIPSTGAPGGRSLVQGRLWAAGKLPDPLVLAREIQPVLEHWGVAVTGFQVLGSTPQEFGLRYGLQTPMVPFQAAFAALREADPHLVVRRFSATLGEKGLYTIDWEVGYATLP